MDDMAQNPCKNRLIEKITDNRITSLFILQKFNYYDEFNLIPTKFGLETTNGNDFTNIIENSSITTGIMISNTEVKKNNIFILILDQTIFIISRTSLHKYRLYFEKNSDSIMFYSSECETNFNENISMENDQEQSQKETNNQSEEIQIEKEIVNSFIKKCQIRTSKFHTEVLDSEYNANNTYNSNKDFISTPIDNIYFNSKDQVFNFLKPNSIDKNYDHEKEFYLAIDNCCPFICKVYGQTEDKHIVLEYIEGETLEHFITNGKNIELKVKMKIICQILFAILYSHSQGFFLRDLKSDNIMVDLSENAFLIDFNYSKKTDPSESDKSYDFGSFYFVAPEISSAMYSYKVDSYSIGLIIHFIITGKKFNTSKKFKNLSEMQGFPKCSKEYEYIFNIYKRCFESSPESRPDIIELINGILFNFNYVELNNIKEKYIYPNLIREFKKYESKFKYNGSDGLIEKSYLEFFSGYIYYYFNDNIQRDVTKAINYLKHSSNKNNPWANYVLGEIYYKGLHITQDISKAINYFTISSNQNNSNAQFYLGKIYYEGK